MSARLPQRLRRFFWDLGSDEVLRWPGDRDTIVPRLLAVGDEDSIRWLRRRVGDEGLRQWILGTGARGLRPQQIAYWSLVLGMPAKTTRQLVERSRVPGGIW